MELDFNQPRAYFTSVDRLGNNLRQHSYQYSKRPKQQCNSITINKHSTHSRYEHPYKVELDLYQPPAEFISPEPSPAFPPPLEATPYTYVDTEALIDELVTHLDTVVELAIDVEHHSYRTYQGECLCLMYLHGFTDSRCSNCTGSLTCFLLSKGCSHFFDIFSYKIVFGTFWLVDF